MVTNIATSLQYINLFIHYSLRRIKNKLVPRKGLALKKMENLIRNAKVEIFHRSRDHQYLIYV
jgi:hypothetical protein